MITDKKKPLIILWDFFRSKSLNRFLLIAAITYTIMLSIWGAASPNQIVVNISNTLPFKVLFITFLINNLLCTIDQLPLTVKSFLIDKSIPDIKALEKKRNSVRIEVLGSIDNTTGRARRYFKLHFYSVYISKDGSFIKAIRGRYSRLGNLIFHLSFFLLLVGILLSTASRSTGLTVVAEGQTFNGLEEEYFSFTPKADYTKRHADVAFTVEKIVPRFWNNDMLLFTGLYSELEPIIPKADSNQIVRLNSSYMPDIFTYINITGIGISPRYLLSDNKGDLIDTAFVNLVSFPPGSPDSFQLDSTPYTVYLKIYPDAKIGSNDKIFNRSNYLRRPVYETKIVKDEETVFTGLLTEEDVAEFDDIQLSFPEARLWGQYRIIKDQGLLFIFTGFIVAIVGLIIRYIPIKKEMTLFFQSDEKRTSVLIGGQSEYFPNLIVNDIVKISRYLGEKRN